MTDSTLLGDGVRVLSCIMRKIAIIAGAVGTKLRDRSRSVKLRLLSPVGGCNKPGGWTGKALL
jgi:hypothetical protein